MNAPLRTIAAAAAEAATQQQPGDFERLLQRQFTPRDLLENDNFDKLWRLADSLSNSALSLPKELKGNIGDCLAVVTQAMIWGLNPFSVAQKAHVINGKLGYEAQLVNAVVMQSGAIRGSFHYEYEGDRCRVGAVLRSEAEVTWGEWLSAATVTTKNSPLWKTNPKQQMGYLQVKNWARAFCPGALLGIYTDDELDDGSAPPPTATRAPAPIRPAAPAPAEVADFDKLLQQAQAEADKGSEVFRAWWKAAKKEQRAALKPHMADFEQRAAKADEPPPAPPAAPAKADPDTGEIPTTGAEGADPWLDDFNTASNGAPEQ